MKKEGRVFQAQGTACVKAVNYEEKMVSLEGRALEKKKLRS